MERAGLPQNTVEEARTERIFILQTTKTLLCNTRTQLISLLHLSPGTFFSKVSFNFQVYMGCVLQSGLGQAPATQVKNKSCPQNKNRRSKFSCKIKILWCLFVLLYYKHLVQFLHLDQERINDLSDSISESNIAKSSNPGSGCRSGTLSASNYFVKPLVYLFYWSVHEHKHCTRNLVIDIGSKVRYRLEQLLYAVLVCSVADPDLGSSAFLAPGSWIRDPGWTTRVIFPRA